MSLILTAGLAALALETPTLGQDPGDDWDLTVRPEHQLTAATLDFGDNLLALRCRAGVLDVLVSGVPASAGPTRRVRVSAGAIADEEREWIAQAGQPVLGADEPQRLARQLRAGGELDLRVEPETEADRARRYRLPVPPSAGSIDAVLSACGVPLVEPRDLLRRVAVSEGPAWRILHVDYPTTQGALRARQGEVQLSCVVSAAWGLDDCRADVEEPEGVGFAGAALDAARRARLSPPESGADVRGQRIRFTVRFRMPD